MINDFKKIDKLEREDELFYVGQKAFIEKDQKVLILYGTGERLDFPGGKIQKGEVKTKNTPGLFYSLQREVREETGLEIRVGSPFVAWHHRIAKNYENNYIYLVGFRCKYVSGEVILSDEHKSFKWVDKNDYIEADDGSYYFYALNKYFN